MVSNYLGQEMGRMRVTIASVTPHVNNGRFAAKGIVGENFPVKAHIFCDGHSKTSANLLHRKNSADEWTEIPFIQENNGEWHASFTPTTVGSHTYTVEAWIDEFLSWQTDLKKKHAADQDLSLDFQIGSALIEKALERIPAEEKEIIYRVLEELAHPEKSKKCYELVTSQRLSSLMRAYPDKRWVARSAPLTLHVQRKKTAFSTWYELFPRSCAPKGKEYGSFTDVETLLPEIQRMGFDVLLLPPIHPIGLTNRKGRNNNSKASEGDPGSPWAIGSSAGGHKSIHPKLGTMESFLRLIEKAKKHDLEIAMDIAFQCSPDHPYIKEHPEWFQWQPDGSLQYVENPPKKYEDIVPFHFDTEDWNELWLELESIVLFWINKGIRIFRVDNPHTKPFLFWEWLIARIKERYPETIFLSEAFTRPEVMYWLAKLGFSQSYTHFIWRNTKQELTQYINELTQTGVSSFFRPNFWPNTPDILSEYLQHGDKPAFESRFILAATLSPSYGIYGPAYELAVNASLPDKEEYLDSETYEIKHWDRKNRDSLNDLIASVNKIRRENSSLQCFPNIEFLPIDSPFLIAYAKYDHQNDNLIIVVVNLDPFHTQSGQLTLPLEKWGIKPTSSFLLHELLSDKKYLWQNNQYPIQIDPSGVPARIFKMVKKIHKEHDFEYIPTVVQNLANRPA